MRSDARMQIDIVPNNSADIYQERVKKLDSWLREKFRNKWDKLLVDNSLNCFHDLSNSELSKFHLLANYLIRISTTYGHDEAENLIGLIQPLGYYGIAEIPGTIELFNNEVIENDLLKIQHPSLPPGSVMTSKHDQNTIYREDLSAAGKILKLVPGLKEESLKYFGAICFVESPNLKQAGECISTSSKYVPGLIYSSEVPPILLAECIIHESAHLQLFYLEAANNLYNDYECSIQTPLRPDLRPPAGLLHQIFVLIRLREFYKTLSISKSSLVVKSMRQIHKRCGDIAFELASGLSAIRDNRSRYTRSGNEIIDTMI